MKKIRVCFVCTGNTCRSPLAQGLFKKLLEDGGIKNVEVLSAGLAAVDGAPVSANSVAAAARLGADISAHTAKSITRDMLENIDLFVCMTQSHLACLEGHTKARVRVLGGGIPDPYGGSAEEYMHCAESIAASLGELLEEVRNWREK